MDKRWDGRPTLSIIVPVHDEEENILPLYHKIRNGCDPLGRSYEIVYVDDGSRDRTFEILEGIHEQDPRVQVIRFRKNYGQTAAMAAGFQYAQGKIILSMDGDLQNDPADIPRLLAKLEEGYDVVCGWRKERKDHLLSRRVPSVIANWLIGKITRVPIHDNGCSLKAYRASVIKNVALYSEMHRFIPAMSTIVGARIAEVVVRHHPRHFGKSKYGIGRVWRVVLDVMNVKMITGFAARPALCFGFLSVPCIILGLSALCVAGGMYYHHLLRAWMVMSTVAFLFFFLGAHLLTMGVIGELSMKTGDYRPTKSVHPTVTVL